MMNMIAVLVMAVALLGTVVVLGAQEIISNIESKKENK